MILYELNMFYFDSVYIYIYSLLGQDLSTIQRKGMLKVGFYWLRAGAHDNDVHARSANGYLDWRSLETFCAVRDIRFNGDAMCTNCMHTYIIYIHTYIYVYVYTYTHIIDISKIELKKICAHVHIEYAYLYIYIFIKKNVHMSLYLSF